MKTMKFRWTEIALLLFLVLLFPAAYLSEAKPVFLFLFVLCLVAYCVLFYFELGRVLWINRRNPVRMVAIVTILAVMIGVVSSDFLQKTPQVQVTVLLTGFWLASVSFVFYFSKRARRMAHRIGQQMDSRRDA